VKLTRLPFYFFIFLLLGAGVALSLYRHFAYNVPWLPGEKQQIWSIESKIEFFAQNEPVKVSFAIPDTQQGFTRIADHTASAGYGLSYQEQTEARRAQWSIRNATGRQTLYYRIDMLVDSSRDQEGTFSVPAIDAQVNGDGPYETAARALLEQALKRSADPFTLTVELIREFNQQKQSSQYLIQDRSRIAWLVSLLQHAQVPAREVLGLKLEDGRRRQKLVSYLQVFTDDGYQLFDPESGRVKQRESLLLWEYYSMPLIDLIGGTNSSVMFSIIEQEVPVRGVEVRVESMIHRF